jgi:glycosyltransferase involved in cell wall biosynthesis
VRVLIVNNMAPFVWGGAEELASHLCTQLVAAGHEADVLRIPFQWEPPERIPSQMLMARSFEITGVDRVIALKFPAYLIRHPRKTLWLLHQYRQAYDLFGTSHSNLGRGPSGEAIRQLIVSADAEAFAESRRIFTNSDITRRRLTRYNAVDSEVLLPPVNDAELFTGGPSEGYVFAGGRVNLLKRQHLLVEAVARSRPRPRLVIAGPPDAPEDGERLRALVRSLGLESRVTLDLRFLSRIELARYVNGSEAVAYLPFDEDSLGYVAMEAACAGKPLVTTSDSGGVLRLARHEQSGWVAEPDAASLAATLSRVGAESARATAMGETARRFWTELDVTWPATIDRLLS